MAPAAASTSRKTVSVTGAAGLTRTATCRAPGTSTRRSSSRFAVISADRKFTPVALPPGRARFATRPNLTGSSLTENTVGTVEVAALASNAGALPDVAITATRRRTRSAASAGKRSIWSSAQRYSIATFSPSVYPASCSPRRKARRRSAFWPGDWPLRNPMTGWCCACRAAEQRDELAASHSITSSASAISLSETVRPSALAVLRLITSSNFVGCSTGRSLGLAPLRTRST